MTPITKFVLFSGFLFISTVSYAADFVWDGGGDGVNWTDTLNWDQDALPGTGDNFSPDGNTIQVNEPGATYSVTTGSASGNVQVNDGGVLTGNGAFFSIIRRVSFNVNDGGIFNVPFDADIRQSVTIASGGTFSGGDEVKDSAVLSIGGEWMPSSSDNTSNTLVVSNGTYELVSGGTLFLDVYGDGINEAFNFTSGGGTLNLDAGSIVLSSQLGYTPAAGDSFDLWDNTVGGTINAGDGTNISLPGFALDVSTFATDGIVTVVPEPRAYALLAGMLAAGVLIARRRSRSASLVRS